MIAIEEKATFLTAGQVIPELVDYEYPADNEKKDKLVEENLLEYKEKMERELRDLMSRQDDIDAMNGIMGEHEFKAEMFIKETPPSKFLKMLMKKREEIVPELKENHHVVSLAIANVHEHVFDELDDKNLKIKMRAKTKKELFNIFKKMDMGINYSDTEDSADKIALDKKTMDLRYSANLKLLEGGVSREERMDFLRDIQLRQRVFREKMKRVKDGEHKNRSRMYNRNHEEREKRRKIHHEIVAERYKNSVNQIKRRKMQREEENMRFEQYKKLRKMNKPHYAKIQDRYMRNVVGDKRRREKVILEGLSDKYKNIDFLEMEEHTKKYDAQRRVQEFKYREKYGLGYDAGVVKHPSNFDTILWNKERSGTFQDVLKRKKAAFKYAEEIQKHFLPRITKKREVNPPFNQTKRRVNLSGEMYKDRLAELGEKYLRESIDYAKAQNKIKLSKSPQSIRKSSATQKLSKTANSKSMAEMRSSKIVHKNYLEELRKSKVIKRNNKEWQNVLESKRHIDMRDRFDLIKSDFEKTDKRIQSLEFLKRQGAGKENPDSNKTEGIYLDSIKAKLALLNEIS